MKSNNIYIFLYHNKIYIICNNNIDIITTTKEIIKEGRINNIKLFIKYLKDSLIIKKSSLKLVDDIITIIYFGNYNDDELYNINHFFKEYGYEKIKLIPIKNIIDNSYNYLFYNNDYYLLIEDNISYLIHPKLYNDNLINIDKTYLMDDDSFLKDNKNCYLISDLPKYLIRIITKRNK